MEECGDSFSIDMNCVWHRAYFEGLTLQRLHPILELPRGLGNAEVESAFGLSEFEVSGQPIVPSDSCVHLRDNFWPRLGALTIWAMRNSKLRGVL